MRPTTVSRVMMRGALAAPSLLVASARTVTVMVCVPALPPIDATIGISTASATICSIVASNSLMTNEARTAVPRLTTSQGTRLCDVWMTLSASDFIADAAQRHHVLVRLALDDLDHVVDRDDADEPLVGIDDRRGIEVVALELAGHLLLVLGGVHDVQVRVHDLGHGNVALAAKQTRQLDAAEDAKRGIDDEDLRERVRQIVGVARVVDDLADGPVGRDGDEIRLHEAAGGLLGIFEVALERDALAHRELAEDLVLVALLEVFENVGRVVGLELGDRPGEQLVRQRLRKLVANAFLELGKDLVIEGRPQRLDERDALIGAEELDEVGEIGRGKILDEGRSVVGRACGKSARHLGYEVCALLLGDFHGLVRLAAIGVSEWANSSPCQTTRSPATDGVRACRGALAQPSRR